MAKRRKDKNIRYQVFTTLMLLVVAALMLRLLTVQVVHRQKFLVLAKDQHRIVRTLSPERGKIYDRHGSVLAFNVPAVTVVANVDSIVDPYKIAHQLSPIIGMSPTDIIKKIRSGRNWIELAKQQPPEVRDRIERFQYKYIGCRDELRRRYPKRFTASQVVGFTRSDGAGGYGLELAKEAELKGKPGTAVMQKTGRARLFSHPHFPIREARDGFDMVLTIDWRYQWIAEQELKRTIAEYNAKGGSVVIMEPSTGEVLAIASEPNFDPNEYDQYNDLAWKLKAITDQFEPGSTFKPAMMAAMLDANYVDEEELVFCENGTWNVMGETIGDTKPHGWLTARDVLVLSSNIGMAKLAKEFDEYKMHAYAHKFGFGRKTDIELPGEISGVLKEPQDWVPFSQLAFSFGHEIAVTPLQMCGMYATLANDGVYVEPRIIKQMLRDGRPMYVDNAPKRRQVITPKTSRLMRDVLADVVGRGTGVNADLPDIEMCGKTGTAHLVQSTGGYASNRYISSFGGFFPRENPRITIFVMITEPRGAYYGGTVAAPCFRNIAQGIINLEGLDYFQSDSLKAQQIAEHRNRLLPNLVGLKRQDAQAVLRSKHLEFRFIGSGQIILQQDPLPGQRVTPDGVVYLTLDAEKHAVSDTVRVPELIDLPLRNAINLLAEQRLKVQINGNGKVVRQEPPAGEAVEPGHTIQIYCKAAI